MDNRGTYRDIDYELDPSNVKKYSVDDFYSALPEEQQHPSVSQRLRDIEVLIELVYNQTLATKEYQIS